MDVKKHREVRVYIRCTKRGRIYYLAYHSLVVSASRSCCHDCPFYYRATYNSQAAQEPAVPLVAAF